MTGGGYILVVRLGAMGDILHALPAAASLRLSFPGKKIGWLVANKWAGLLEGNPDIDDVILFDRHDAGALWTCWRRLRRLRPEIAIDFQGLVQSAMAGRASRPRRFFGREHAQAREGLAAIFYSDRVHVQGPHCIEEDLEIAAAAGATMLNGKAWLPQGKPEGDLPAGPFVLTSPFAGWVSKQWPLENYVELARELGREGLPLVVNVAPGAGAQFSAYPELRIQESSLAGLIDATRRATAIVGVDSGPMHLAAALSKPGVAIFGPTDPARNGPFYKSIVTLRDPAAITTYRRGREADPSMRAIGVQAVKERLLSAIRSVDVSAS